MKSIICLLLLAAAVQAADNTVAVVVKPVANMYSRASEEADVVSQAIYSANVAVLERKDGWAQIRTADAYTGWVPETALRIGHAYPASGRGAEVSTMFAHIYREASVTKHAPLLTVPFETKLEALARPASGERWVQVRLADDRSGWVQSGDVNFEPKPLTIPEMLEFSKRFLGLPYTWGGSSSYGYDCSGLAQMLVRRRGVVLPRDAGPQAQFSGVVPVKLTELQPGDLLYFGGSETKITHTGVYMGDGKFINATTHNTPVTQIDRLDDPHWAKLLVAARRVKQ
jgi:gamma-D-glutamyl-L-lysine dipeptidyl-peptidase